MAQAIITRRKSSGGVNTDLPEQVTEFIAFPNSAPHIALSWQNPTDYWAGTLIVRKVGSAPDGVNDGEAVYNGTGATFVDTNVEYNVTYYYRAFPYNEKKQYQTLFIIAKAMPVENVPLSQMPEGALISIPENGVDVSFYVAKHDYENGLNGSGRTLVVRKDLHSQMAFNASEVNTYASSTIDTWLNGDYKSLFDTGIQTAMGTTKFYYTIGNGNATVSTLSRSVFLISVAEYDLIAGSGANTEGSALPVAANIRIAYFNDIATGYWTRSASPSSTDTNKKRAFIVGNTGTVGIARVTVGLYARPAFTLPNNTLVMPLPNADGSYDFIE